jgi:hypothetical protein
MEVAVDFRTQTTQYGLSGLSALAATLLLSASAVAASNSGMPCAQVGRDLKSLEITVEALTLTAVDHVPIAQNAAKPNTPDGESHVTESEIPYLYLTPRVTSILRDVFGTTAEDLSPALPPVKPKLRSSSPLADSEETADSATVPDDVAIESDDMPRYQHQMYRTDI